MFILKINLYIVNELMKKIAVVNVVDELCLYVVSRVMYIYGIDMRFSSAECSAHYNQVVFIDLNENIMRLMQ